MDRCNEMIHDQASKLTARLARKKVIDEKSHEVYTYGFELIISALNCVQPKK